MTTPVPRYAGLADIPADVRNLIFSHLLPGEVAPLAAVHPRWRQALVPYFENRYRRALQDAQLEFDTMVNPAANCHKVASLIMLTECPASPLWPSAAAQEGKLAIPWAKQPEDLARSFYTELKAAVATGSAKYFNEAWQKYKGVATINEETLSSLSSSLLFMAGQRFHLKMQRMYARCKCFANSAASAASYSGYTQCVLLTEVISKESYDRSRAFAAAAAGGQLEVVRAYAKDRHGADLLHGLVAAASRGQRATFDFILAAINGYASRTYIPWNQVMRACALHNSPQTEDLIALCVQNRAREFQEAISIATAAKNDRVVALLHKYSCK